MLEIDNSWFIWFHLLMYEWVCLYCVDLMHVLWSHQHFIYWGWGCKLYSSLLLYRLLEREFVKWVISWIAFCAYDIYESKCNSTREGEFCYGLDCFGLNRIFGREAIYVESLVGRETASEIIDWSSPLVINWPNPWILEYVGWFPFPNSLSSLHVKLFAQIY